MNFRIFIMIEMGILQCHVGWKKLQTKLIYDVVSFEGNNLIRRGDSIDSLPKTI